MKKVIIIEDDPKVSRLLAQSFRHDLDTDLDFAPDFVKGLAMILERQYDLYLVDLNLGTWSGLDLIKSLSDQQSIDNRVIVMSSEITREDQLKGYSLGVSNFIQKPIDIEILKAVMKKNLRMLDRESPHQLSYAGLTLAPGKLNAIIKQGTTERTIKLSPTEYRIIELLVQSKGNIVKKEDLSFTGRDQNKELSFATVEVHISSLRKKLSEVNGPVITSQWGVGYFLEHLQIRMAS